LTSGYRSRRHAFVDTSAFYALANAKDASHNSASIIQRRLLEERCDLHTSAFIIAETHALALRRLGRTTAQQLLANLDAATENGSLRVSSISEQDQRNAREIIHRYDDKNFSLTDALSFAVMERLGIETAFSFDRDFEQFGLTILVA
jgi:uncharacterized protein